jgi:DNA-binding NarL/FixJ family response regulator
VKRELKLLIVDDHPIFRHGLREIIEQNPGFRVIAEAPDGQVALRLISEIKPDIAIVDIDMPKLDGLKMVQALSKNNLSTPVIFLTMHKEEDIYNAAVDLGVKAYLLKENAAQDIVSALEMVAEGGTYISPSMLDVSRRRGDRAQQLLASKPQIETLSPAERRILKLIADDHTSKEIAELLKISFKTVENHRLNICNKLNLHGSHSLLKFAFDHKSDL